MMILFIFSGWLGAMSMSISFLVSPIIIGFCRRKSTRLTAVMGGLVTALGCLFTSFASQFHQLFFSYGAMIGKKKPEKIEITGKHFFLGKNRSRNRKKPESDPEKPFFIRKKTF